MKNTLVSLIPILGLSLLANSASADTVNARFPKSPRHPDNVFTRMFPNLSPFAEQTDRVRETVKVIGAKDGLLDAKDVNPDNPKMTAGFTFFGQFLDHDITLDKKSLLNANAQPKKTVNFRTAAFDLDSVFGEGPAGSPELYETSSGRIKFLVQAIPGSEALSRNGAVRYDLNRDSNGGAIVAESRNDENIVISQFHLAMLRFHNAVTDHLAAQPEYRGASAEQIFADARRLVTWHYQWIILHEFLPVTIGQDRLDQIIAEGLKFYDLRDHENNFLTKSGEKMPRIPIEFSVAAYRFGHSQVRPGYRVNFGPTGGSPFFAAIFDDTLDPNATDPDDMRGGRRAPRRFVDWQTFFSFGDPNFPTSPNKLIDAKLSSPLMLLPGSRGVPAPGLPSDGLQSLASRNLTRHVNFGLPSGQAIAKKMKVPALTATQLSELAPHGMDSSTPLWFYVLKEAELMEDGQRLGPVGARIVGEVFVGLLKADPSSYFTAQPNWQPTLPSASTGTFRMTDLLKFAGVVPPLVPPL